MTRLPTISIVVPNFNAGATLAASLDSLLSQGYPNLELLVADGGSTDNSVEVIRRYEKHLAWWVSEKDRGQAHAINKGFAHASGEVVNWLCSDDALLPGALATVGQAFAEDPQVDVVVGGSRQVRLHEGGRTVDLRTSMERIQMLPIVVPFCQPSCFYRRRLLDRPGPLDETYHYQMDVELWCYFHSKGVRWRVLDAMLSEDRFSGQNKTATGGPKIAREAERIYCTYTHERIPLAVWHRRLRYPLEGFRHRHPGRLAFALARPLQIAAVLALGPFYGFRRVRSMNWSSWT